MSPLKIKPFWLAVIAPLTALTAWSQTPQKFDVASIRRVEPQGFKPVEAKISVSPAGATLRGATLRDAILTAYNVKDHQVSGPAWIGLERYDIVAKPSEPTESTDQTRQMLQSLLADRFKLELHREIREAASFAMVKGKSEAKLGSVKPEGESSLGIDGARMMFHNYSMARLADFLSQRSPDRPVVDATGIEGYYDFAIQLLDHQPENPGDVKRAMGQAMRDGSLARMATEQLGLRLESRKGPLEMLIVDRAEKSPVEN